MGDGCVRQTPLAHALNPWTLVITLAYNGARQSAGSLPTTDLSMFPSNTLWQMTISNADQTTFYQIVHEMSRMEV